MRWWSKSPGADCALGKHCEKTNVDQGVQGYVDKNWQSQNLSPSFNMKKNQLLYVLMMMIMMTTTTCMYMM